MPRQIGQPYHTSPISGWPALVITYLHRAHTIANFHTLQDHLENPRNDIEARMAHNGSIDVGGASKPSPGSTSNEEIESNNEPVRKEEHEALVTAPTTSDVSAKARDITSQVLEFLSSASNETLGACLVGLGATTWLILGRVGLVLIGIVVGVVLQATWEGDGQSHANGEARALEARKRRQKGLDVVERVLDWRERTDKGEQSGEDTQTQKVLNFSGFPPQTGAALTGLTECVVRDYVKYVDQGNGSHPAKC